MIFQRPFVDNTHLVTGTGDILDNVGRENNDPVARQFYQKISETDSFPGVQSGSRFIDNQNAGQVQQSLCNSDPLFHTS